MYSGQTPDWKCPHCKKGRLTIKKKDFRSEETAQSKRERDHPHWEPDWLRYIFSAFLNCTSCDETTVVVGDGRIDGFYDPETGKEGGEEVFMPKYFIPPLPIFDIPNKCPEEVEKHLHESFELAWADFSAAGNKLRIAVERLVDNLAPDSKGSLHDRIQALSSSHDKIKESLLAIKWLGNDGSHESTLEECDVAFAYEVFGLVLNNLYGKTKNLGTLVQLVNEAKGSIAK